MFCDNSVSTAPCPGSPVGAAVSVSSFSSALCCAQAISLQVARSACASSAVMPGLVQELVSENSEQPASERAKTAKASKRIWKVPIGPMWRPACRERGEVATCGRPLLCRISMQYSTPLIPARLVRRYKRFLADMVLEDGTEITAHCANPGGMLALAEPGRRCWLSHDPNPKR